MADMALSSIDYRVQVRALVPRGDLTKDYSTFRVVLGVGTVTPPTPVVPSHDSRPTVL